MGKIYDSLKIITRNTIELELDVLNKIGFKRLKAQNYKSSVILRLTNLKFLEVPGGEIQILQGGIYA